LRELARQAQARLRRSGDTLEIALVDDAESRRVNRDYLGRDRPTNVISFAADAPGEMGQLIVNIDEAERQRGAAGYGLLQMLGYYVLHGMLHLAGYDHERGGAAAAARMAAKERTLRALLRALPEEESE
jgi:probable rRNA maturation factor